MQISLYKDADTLKKPALMSEAFSVLSSPPPPPPLEMVLRSQCLGVHISLDTIQELQDETEEPFGYQRGIPSPILLTPEESSSAGTRVLLKPHNMELRSECSGFHDALMRFGDIPSPSRGYSVASSAAELQPPGVLLKPSNMELRIS